MIRIDDLTLRRGVKVLLEHANATLMPGERIGLVGPNGAGKSSLFALLRGELHADGGEAAIPPNWRLAHVAQETPGSERSAIDAVIDGDVRLRAVEAEIARLEAADAAAHARDPHAHGHGEELGHLHAEFADLDGYTVESRAASLLLGLGFSLEQTRAPVGSFSGGWRMRINLAQALMCPSDLLLLDEPTNHLDLDAIVWLEQWLKRYAGTLVVISHDREFLDAICNVILHIDGTTLKRYGGNYTSFEKQRAMQTALAAAAYARQQREIEHLQGFIDRFKAKASKARQAQSRVKALERMELLTPTYISSPFTFRFRTPEAAPDPLLMAEDLACGYRLEEEGRAPIEKRILERVRLTLRVGERIGLLGANGQGKSTLIKTLAGTQPPLAGTLRAGKGLQIGYFAQHQVDMLRLDETPLQQLARIAPTTREQELRNFLGSFDFGNEMATSLVAPFSGGEKARLALALIIWTKPNLLLLDEPTNHLDLETREALTVALAQFEGTLILVSHDRALLRATTDSFLLVTNGQVAPFDGDLDEYRDWLLGKAQAAESGAAKPAQAAGKGEVPVGTTKTAEKASSNQGTRPANAGNAGNSGNAANATNATNATNAANAGERRDQRRQEAEARNARAKERKPIETRIKRLDEQLAKLAVKKTAMEARLADPALYEDANREELRTLLSDQAWLTREIDTLEAEWLEQQEALEKLDA